MNRNRLHTPLVRKTMLAIQRELGDGVAVFQRNTGGAEIAPGAFVKFGISGGADIHGYVTGGVPFEIEVKTGTGRLQDNQEAWRRRCMALGVPWLLVHAASAEDLDTAACDAAKWVRSLRDDRAATANPSSR